MDHKRVAVRLIKLLTVRIRAFAVDFRVRPNARVYVALGIFGWPPQGNIYIIRLPSPSRIRGGLSRAVALVMRSAAANARISPSVPSGRQEKRLRKTARC